MQDTRLKEIYRQVLEEIRGHPEIRGTQRGLLYKTIQIINEEETSEIQEKTRSICNELGIKSNAHIQEDKDIFIELMDIFYKDELFPIFSKNEFIVGLFRDGKKNVIQFWLNENEPMEWIIIAAVSLVGIFGSQQFLKNRKGKARKPKKQIQEQVSSKPEPSLPPITAILSLIVSASTVRELNLVEEDNINLEMLKEIIDRSYYFTCDTKTGSSRNEENLEIVNEPILADSPREVYLRIKIEDGRSLLEKPINLRYTLKGKLPDRGKFKIEKIACLGGLSGLEKFVRA